MQHFKMKWQLLQVNPCLIQMQRFNRRNNWQSHVFNPNAFMRSTDFSIAGASDKGSYFSSVSLFDQDGIVAEGKSNFQRLAARLNTTTNVNDRFTVGWNVAYTHNESQSVAENTEFGSPLGRALNIDPLTPLIRRTLPTLSQAPYTSGGVLRSNLVRDEGRYLRYFKSCNF
jgi:hypothetical protein